MRAKILGWNVSINLSKLKVFPVKFQYDYGFYVFLNYLMKGEYQSDVPFGLFQNGDSLLILAQKKPKFIHISYNPAIILEEITLPTDPIQGLETFVFTSAYNILVKHGYKKPIDVRSFIGKSKGLASLRDKPRHTIKHNYLNREITYSVAIAERFETHLKQKNEVFLFYDPRYEIFESWFNLTSVSLIPDSVKEYSHQLIRSFESVSSRFQEISAILTQHNSAVINFQELKDIVAKQARFPSLTLANYTLSADLHTQPYEEVLKNNIKLSPINNEVLVIIDQIGTKDPLPDCVHQFIQRFQTLTGMNVETFFITSTDQQIPKYKLNIIILNDEQSGFEWIYDFLKSIIKIPSKAIKVSTINNTTKIEELIYLTWLSLCFRSSNKLYAKLENNTFYNTLAIHLIPFLKGDWLLIRGVLLQKDEIQEYKQSFYNIRKNKNQMSEIICSFLYSMDTLFNDKATMILFNKLELLPILKEFAKKHSFTLVFIKESNSLFFSLNEFENPVPVDGMYYHISSKKYLLVTNGFPNKPDGVPKPIIVDIIYNVKYSEEEIIEAIFHQTFINPTSFTKTKFPFPLSYATSELPDSVLISR